MEENRRPDLLVDRVPQPDGVAARLRAQIAFVLEADRLKSVLRRTQVLSPARPENSAEHSWHLAMMVLVLAEYADEPIDVGRTLRMVLVHDLVEIYAGDSPVYEPIPEQEERERRAAAQLFGLLPDDQGAHLRALWEEFEARATPEARFAKAMDRLQPTLLNYNARGGTWATPGVTEREVRERKAVIGEGSTELWEYAQMLISTGARQGWLRAAPRPDA